MKTFLVRCWVVVGVLGLAAGAWAQQPVPPPASQTEVNAGADGFKYVTPATLAAYSLNQATGSISAATATNIAVAASEIRDTTLSNVLSARLIATNGLLGTAYTNADTVVSNGLSVRLDGTNTALRAAWALADNVVSNALSARLIATNANLQPLDSDLTAIAALGDPNADRLLFWDDSAGAFAYLTAGSGLTISGTTITSSGGGGGGTGMQNPATADFQVANYSLLDVDTIYGNDGAHGADLSLHSYDSDSTIKLYTFDSGNGIQYASQVGHTFTGPVTFNDGVTSGGTWSIATINVSSSITGNGGGITNIPVQALWGSGGANTAATNGTAGMVQYSAGNGGIYWGAAPTGGTASTTNAISDTFRVRRATWAVPNASATAQTWGIGETWSASGGTPEFVEPDANGPMRARIYCNGTTGQNAGLNANGWCTYYTGKNADWEARFITGGLTNLMRLWVGLASTSIGNMTGSDTPNYNYAAFRFSDTINSKFYFCTSASGGSVTATDTGITIQPATQYRLRVVEDTSNARWIGYINGTAVATNTATLPSAAKMQSTWGWQTGENVAKTNFLCVIHGSCDW